MIGLTIGITVWGLSNMVGGWVVGRSVMLLHADSLYVVELMR